MRGRPKKEKKIEAIDDNNGPEIFGTEFCAYALIRVPNNGGLYSMRKIEFMNNGTLNFTDNTPDLAIIQISKISQALHEIIQ